MRGYLTIIGLIFMTSLSAQEKDYWILKSDTTDLESFGYVDLHNKIKIPFGKYPICYTDTFWTYAVVLKTNEGFIAIDRQENKLFTIYPFDNGPDYQVDGTFRIIDNKKMGIADTTGKIIVPAIYDFTFGFEDGLALLNCGGVSVSIDPQDPNCEYHTWEGGKWGVADRTGRLILPVEYEYKRDQKTGNIHLFNKLQKFVIIKGEILKR
jgi:hypothetical protein